MDERLPEEEDLMSRSIKKVKMNGENIVTESMEITEGETRETKQTSVTANDNQKTNEEEYAPEDLDVDLSTDDQVPFNPKPTIEVSLEEYEDWCRPWKLSLILKPLGKNFNLQALDRWVQRRWMKKGSIRVMDLAGNFFLVRFTDQDDYAHALFEGPWMIADHYLLVQRWRPLFLPQETDVQKVAVWIRIPNLPIELYNKFFLWKVGKTLGTMLKVDELTSIHSRDKFARICVEIDLKKKIVPSFTALGKDFNIVYEGLHQICFNCGKYGHRIEQCSESITGTTTNTAMDPTGGRIPSGDEGSNGEMQHNRQASQNQEANQEEIKKIKEDQEGNPFGPWMIVKKNQRKNKPKSDPSKKDKKESIPTSRFHILAEKIHKGNQENEESDLDTTPIETSEAYKDTQEARTSEKSVTKQTSKNGSNSHNQRSQQKHKNPIPIMKGKNTAISKKTPTVSKHVKQSSHNQRNIKGLQTNQDSHNVFSDNQANNQKAQDNQKDKEERNQEYWKQFSYLTKQVARTNCMQPALMGGHLDHTTRNLISTIMGGGNKEYFNNTEAKSPLDPGESSNKAGKDDPMERQQRGEECLRSIEEVAQATNVKPIEA
ncbi:hypothetical protein Ahy_B06g081187 [Arachis hypogaea]|uniref:CCHC-type domain-containing protein n=1 Tax=Arachis hypogaea TaxID=3818 RepID=A0A444YKB5_ARAHY|nr:hypothetical protein Ahy_B06g081187 [Arachis hypogaea]